MTKNISTNKERLITAAIDLMLSQGYNATTVDEICDTANASKGSFYHYFKSKEEIGLAALEKYYEFGSARMMSGPFMKESDPMKRMIGFLIQIEKNAHDFWEHGCLLGTFAVDLAETNSRIRERVAELFEQIAMNISIIFKPLVKVNKKESSAKEIAYNYLTTLEGGIVMAKAFNDPNRIRESLVGFRKQLNLDIKK